MSIRCSYCSKPAIYIRKYSGENLCKNHFIRSIEKKVHKTIRSFLKPDIKIGLAVSGGKDSVVMAYIIRKMLKNPSESILGILVDEGIKGYREFSLKYAESIMRKLGLKYVKVGFKDFFGITLNEITDFLGDAKLACTYCGVLRRRLLDIIGNKFGLAYIFTGHNANDVAQTLLLNIIQGNITHIISKRTEIENFIPRIYPLKYIREEEIILYAKLKGLEYYPEHCPYRPTVLRNKVRVFIEELEKDRPGIVYNILHIAEKLSEYGEEEKLHKCIYCGFPSKRKVCKSCELLINLGLKDRIIRIQGLNSIEIKIYK